MPMINNRFGTLLAAKRAKEKRNIAIAEVARDIKVSRITLQSWANNTVTRFDAAIVDSLCRYFGVGLSDLLEYVPDNPPESPPSKK